MSSRVFHGVLVGSDLSRASDRLIQEACEIASRLGADLHVVSAYPPPSPRFGTSNETVPEAVMEEVRHALPAQLRRVLPESRRPTSEEVRFGAPAAIILERVSETGSDLVVLGPHRGRDIHAQFLGTTADEVIRGSEVPCLVLRGRLSLPISRIGVATDFSEIGERALEHALRWAAELGSEGGKGAVCVVHVLPPSALSERENCELRLQNLVASALERAGGVLEIGVETEILVRNDVASALVEWAEQGGIELFTIGTHGRSGWQRAVLGSISSSVARRAPCPVLLVPRSPDVEHPSD